MAFEVFARAMKDKYKGEIIISVILFLLILWVASFYPSIRPTMDSYEQMFDNPSMKAFLGDIANLDSFQGFLAVEVFSYTGLVLGAYVAFLTASFVAGEIEQKSSELMLSLPVSRVRVILSRFATLLPIIVVLVIAMLLGIVAGASYVGESIDTARFAYAMVTTAAFMLAIGGGSLLLSALMSNGRNAAFAAIGVLLAMFLVENIGSMVTSIDWARRLSLFHYARVAGFISDPSAQFSWTNCGILLAVAVAFLALAVIVYQRRDINVT